jgi:hypothetical protein
MGSPFEFLDEDGGAAAEADETGQERPRVRLHRRPLVWVGAALFALAGTWAAVRPHDSPDAGPVHVTPPPVSTSWEIGTPHPQPRPFGSCPSYVMCLHSSALPASLPSALRRHFPHARIDRVATVEFRRSVATQPVLVERVVAASVPPGRLRVVVRVDRGAQPTAPSAADTGRTLRLAHFNAETAGFTIDLFWTGPAGATVPHQRLRALAEEPAVVLSD